MAGHDDNPNMTHKVYIGDLDENADPDTIRSAFNKFGDVKSVWVSKKPPGFAFVEFYDMRDADDAIRKLDGTELYEGCRVKVQPAHTRGDQGRGGRSGGGFSEGRGHDRRNIGDEECFSCGRRGHFQRDCRFKSRGSFGGGSGRRYRSRSR